MGVCLRTSPCTQSLRQLLELIESGNDPCKDPKPDPIKPKPVREPKEKSPQTKVKALLGKAQDKLLEAQGWENLLKDAGTHLACEAK